MTKRNNLTIADESNGYMPLTREYADETDHLLIALLTWRYTNVFVTYNLDGPSARIIRDTSLSIKDAREASGLSRQTFDKYSHAVPEKIEFDDTFIILLPFKVLDTWVEWIQQWSPKSRECWTKLFFYLYTRCCANDAGFYNSVDNIARDLKMDHSDVSRKLIELENANFICRSSFAPVVGLSRIYSIPADLKYFSR